MRKHGFLALGLVILMVSQLSGQDKPVRWKRSAETGTVDVQLFHSTHAVSLPTAETHQKNDFEFEISHRFAPAISDGYEELFGLDGPVNMRIALGYAVTDRWLITLGRSNVDDNLDFQIKYKALQLRSDAVPALIAARVGAAWNPVRVSRFDGQGNLVVRHRNHKRNFQYYGQIIFNTLIRKRFGIGLIPSFLFNRDIRLEGWENSFVMGLNAQVYLNPHWSLLGEWAPTLTDKFGRHNPVAVGIELETGGHFFKLFVTNQTLINPSQFLAGAEYPFDGDNLRLGFLITRVL